MDVESDFRALLSNQYRPPEFYRRWFAFTTVFYKSHYTGIYCCCPCGFDHEFLNYISDDGEIYKEILDQVLQNILKGECPHVDYAPRAFLKETSINAVHVAAAVGTPEVLRQVEILNVLKKSSIFHLYPVMVGVSKKNFRGLAQFYEIYTAFKSPGNYKPLFIARKSNNSTCANAVKIEETSVVAFCLKHRSLILLKDRRGCPTLTESAEIVKCLSSDKKSEIPGEILSFLMWFAEGKNIREHLFSIFCREAVSETAIVNGNTKIVKQLLEMNSRTLSNMCIRESDDTDYEISVYLGKTAIIYDQPDSLNAALVGCIRNRDKFKTDKYSFGELCSILRRRKCQKVLLDHCIHTPEPDNVPLLTKAKILYHVLDNVYNCDKQEIEKLLKGLMEINEYDRSVLQSYIKESQIIDIRIIRMLMELDAKIDSVKLGENALLTDLLRRMRFRNFYGARTVLELLLYGNHYSESNITAVEEGLDLDACELDGTSKTRKAQDMDIAGEYFTDSKVRCFFKLNILETLHLDFYGPLLIECGLLYSKDTILKYQNKQLHFWEHEYLQQCIDNTRSLKLICRDSLRRHFKRKIHEFVEVSGLPESLKDFILLKRELMTLK